METGTSRYNPQGLAHIVTHRFVCNDVGSDEGVHRSLAAGSKRYAAPRKRGHSKNGRSDAPQIVIGLAVTRGGFPIRHWIFPGNTVDVSTVKRVKEELKGWRLNRCVFIGDAGRVSKDHLAQLARGGGHYLVCMLPIHRGGEVSEDVVRRPGRLRKVAEFRPSAIPVFG